jgi:hypothetical protein
MEREIANVAAASAMRGFRYMVFPPIVFDAPAIEVALPAWNPAPPAAPVTPVPTVSTVPAPPSMQTLAGDAEPAARGAEPAVMVPPSLKQARPALREAAPAGRRFALITEVSAELRRPGPR